MSVVTFTRAMLLQAWHSSRRLADASPFAVTLTAPAFAGYALETSGGDVIAARGLVPVAAEVFWGRVHEALDCVCQEEQLPRAAAGARR